MARVENGSNSAYAKPAEAVRNIVERASTRLFVAAEDIAELQRIVVQDRWNPPEVDAGDPIEDSRKMRETVRTEPSVCQMNA